jgi:SAM-dependent methyltransferase
MPDWDSLFVEKEHRWEKPYEDVVSLFGSDTGKQNTLMLDLGCGAGRHLKYLEGKHFAAIGMDLSSTGLSFAAEKLTTEGLPVRLLRADMAAPLPFPSNCFDDVVSIHVIFHNPRQLVQNTISEIYRVMKPGATFLVTFNSTLSFRCGKGINLEPDTWIPDVGADRGIPHHFSSLSDVVDLMHQFKVVKIRLEENNQDGHVSAHWVVTAQKT